MSESSRKPNKLISEKSPYLLQHAYNPVDWYPWSPEAFAKAESEDKPILLSIGYATCHWCHVMERESFEDESTAELLNRDFVCIKLDREERPDIDKIYMDALHAMDQQGGWPLNMFLTPDKKPIAGGTYFPPEPKYGRKSFKEVLAIIRQNWDTRKADLIQSSNSLVEYLISESRAKTGNLPSEKSFPHTVNLYNKFFDEVYYGFKMNMMNKFPPSMGLSFLLFYHSQTLDQRSLFMVEKTLEAMKKGGIYDQVGGGLCRYATNHSWLIPHFEKMLYDNSLFLYTLTEAYQITKKEFYKFSARDIVSYINRDMKLSGGGIASAEDADSEGEEGKFYVWDFKEFEEGCAEDADILGKYWNVTVEGNFEGNNILNESFNLDFPKENDINRKEFEFIKEKARKNLLSLRNKRIRPLRDDKVLTSWNSLYIRSLAYAGIIFDDSNYIQDAKGIYNFIYENLFDSNGRLLRRYREGEAKFLGYLSDYAELISASIYLYRASFESKYLQNAKDLTEKTIQLFLSDLGPFYETGIDGEKLIRRSIDSHDGVEPSGNSSMAYNLVILAAYGIETERYRKIAEKIFSYFQEELETRAISHSHLLSAYYFYVSEPKEIAIVSKKDSDSKEDLLRILNQTYIPNSVLAYSSYESLSENSRIIPLLEGRESNHEFAVYICRYGACELPIYDLESFEKRIGEFNK